MRALGWVLIGVAVTVGLIGLGLTVLPGSREEGGLTVGLVLIGLAVVPGLLGLLLVWGGTPAAARELEHDVDQQ